MTTFFIENKLFLVSAVLLGGLIVGTSQLQQWHDADNARGAGDVAAASSGSTKTPWQAPPRAASASVQTQAPAVTSASKATVPAVSPVQRRVYNGERDDD